MHILLNMHLKAFYIMHWWWILKHSRKSLKHKSQGRKPVWINFIQSQRKRGNYTGKWRIKFFLILYLKSEFKILKPWNHNHCIISSLFQLWFDVCFVFVIRSGAPRSLLSVKYESLARDVYIKSSRKSDCESDSAQTEWWRPETCRVCHSCPTLGGGRRGGHVPLGHSLGTAVCVCVCPGGGVDREGEGGGSCLVSPHAPVRLWGRCCLSPLTFRFCCCSCSPQRRLLKHLDVRGERSVRFIYFIFLD